MAVEDILLEVMNTWAFPTALSVYLLWKDYQNDLDNAGLNKDIYADIQKTKEIAKENRTKIRKLSAKFL